MKTTKFSEKSDRTGERGCLSEGVLFDKHYQSLKGSTITQVHVLLPIC
jgi:hypothetical protein